MVFSSHTLSLNGWSLFISHEMLVFASQRAFRVQARRGKGVMWVVQEGEVTRRFSVAAQQEAAREEARKRTKAKIAWMGGWFGGDSCPLQRGTPSPWGCSVQEMSDIVCLSWIMLKSRWNASTSNGRGDGGNRAGEKSVRSAGTWGIIISLHLMDVLI